MNYLHEFDQPEMALEKYCLPPVERQKTNLVLYTGIKRARYIHHQKSLENPSYPKEPNVPKRQFQGITNAHTRPRYVSTNLQERSTISQTFPLCFRRSPRFLRPQQQVQDG